MIQALKNHKWAVILALIAAVVIACPQPYLRYDLGGAYRGIELFGINDEISWLSRVREAYDGHPGLGNAYFKEGKDDPYVIQPLGSAIIGSLGLVFGLDINNTILLSRILFSFLVFLLIYGFILLFTKEKLIALATSSFLMVGNSLFSRPAVFNILKGESPRTNFINYTRPVNPLMTHFFFFGFLLFFWLFYEKKQWRWGILSALFLGLSFYDYFYTWTFLYSFLGVLALIFLFQKRWQEFKRIGLIVLGASIIAIPYLVNLYQVTIWPTYIEVSTRVGLVENRALVIGLVVPLMLLIFLLFFPRKWRERYYFALALLIAPFIVLNQQVITGRVLHSGHYHWYYNMPLAIILLLLIFFSYFPFKKILAALVVIISIGTGIFVQSSSYAVHREGILEWQKYGPLMDWLNKNAEKEEVIFSNNQVAFLIVIYTPLNVFYHSTVGGTLSATHERLLNTLFLYYRLAGVGSNEVEQVFTKDRGSISEALYGTHFRESTGQDGYLPEELLSDLIGQYQESLKVSTGDFFKGMLERYGVKYLVWDRKTNPQWQLDQYPFLKKVAEIEDFALYQMLP